MKRGGQLQTAPSTPEKNIMRTVMLLGMLAAGIYLGFILFHFMT
mgnify:CR=1 FL=1